MTNWLQTINLDDIVSRKVMYLSRSDSSRRRYLSDIDQRAFQYVTPYSHHNFGFKFHNDSGTIHGLPKSYLLSDFDNSHVITESNWSWVAKYIRPMDSKKIERTSCWLVPTIWEVYKNYQRSYSNDSVKEDVYRPIVHPDYPILLMYNIIAERNFIGMIRYFNPIWGNSYFIMNKPLNDKGPYEMKLTRVDANDMSCELKQVKFDHRWDFDLDEYDPMYHDPLDTDFFRDEIGLLGAMRYG